MERSTAMALPLAPRLPPLPPSATAVGALIQAEPVVLRVTNVFLHGLVVALFSMLAHKILGKRKPSTEEEKAKEVVGNGDVVKCVGYDDVETGIGLAMQDRPGVAMMNLESPGFDIE